MWLPPDRDNKLLQECLRCFWNSVVSWLVTKQRPESDLANENTGIESFKSRPHSQRASVLWMPPVAESTKQLGCCCKPQAMVRRSLMQRTQAGKPWSRTKHRTSWPIQTTPSETQSSTHRVQRLQAKFPSCRLCRGDLEGHTQIWINLCFKFQKKS